VGPIEERLADRVVSIMWRLGRSERAETALFEWRIRQLQVSKLANQVGSHESTLADLCFLPHITDEAAHESEATQALARAKDERDRDAVLLGRAVDADAKESDALGKLACYEGVWNGRSFGPSRSFAISRTDAGTVPRPRFCIPLRSSRKTQNDGRHTRSSKRGAKHKL
jgi:hypothetical protein